MIAPSPQILSIAGANAGNTALGTADNAVRLKIIHQAGELFFQFGASKVTMEEIADRLGMSKKTLYKFFASKDDLLAAVLDDFHCAMQGIVEPLLQAASNADREQFVVIMLQLGDKVASVITRNQQSPLLKDVQRNYPVLWQRIEERRKTTMTLSLRSMLQQGMERGVFRSDLNYDLFLMVYMAAMQEVMNPATLATLPLTVGEAYKMVIGILFGGALTDSGRELTGHIPMAQEWMNNFMEAHAAKLMNQMTASGMNTATATTTASHTNDHHPFIQEGLVEIM
jgi:AcrR family transcriptional regulator